MPRQPLAGREAGETASAPIPKALNPAVAGNDRPPAVSNPSTRDGRDDMDDRALNAFAADVLALTGRHLPPLDDLRALVVRHA